MPRLAALIFVILFKQMKAAMRCVPNSAAARIWLKLEQQRPSIMQCGKIDRA
jgi:hypothetical protein